MPLTFAIFRYLFQVEVYRRFCLMDCLVVRKGAISEVIVKNRNFVLKNNRDRLRGGGLKTRKRSRQGHLYRTYG